FPGSSLRFWGNSRCKFSLLSIVSGKKSTHFLICESQLLSNLTQSHSLAAKLYYFLLVFLNVAVFSGHSKDLLWYFYSTTGGLLFSLSTFTGAVQFMPKSGCSFLRPIGGKETLCWTTFTAARPTCFPFIDCPKLSL